MQACLQQASSAIPRVPPLTLTALCRKFSAESERTVTALAKALVVDTLDLMKKFEKVGMTRVQSEAITKHITELIIFDREKLCDQFVSKSALEKVMLEQDAKVTGFKNELQKTQDVHLASVNKDLERQQNLIDKIRSDIRHEVDKLTASQRLDLNLEKGRMRDELQSQRDKATELEIKLDREVNELRARVETSKNDVIKSVIAIMGTFSAIAFTISRFLQMS